MHRTLYENGIDVDWRSYHKAAAVPGPELPGYPFQRQTFSILADVTSARLPKRDASCEVSQAATDDASADSGPAGLIRANLMARTMVDVRRLFTRIVWRQAEAEQPATAWGKANERPTAVALFCDEAGRWSAIAEALRECGIPVHEIRRGGQVDCDGEGRWRIRAERGDDYREVFDRITAQCEGSHQKTVLAIVYLWSLDLHEAEGAHEIDFAQVQLITCEAPVHIYQSLSYPGRAKQARVWFVTEGVAPVYGLPVAVSQSPIWGVAKCAGWELPDLCGGIVDVDPRLNGELGGRLRAVMAGPRECVYALGIDSTQVCRLAAFDGATARDQGADALFQTGASYLISGGCGALGLAVANWLSERGVRNIILTNRSRPSDAAVAAIERLRSAGVDIALEPANVASPEEVLGIFKRARERSRPVKGVFHLAGTTADGSLRLQTKAQFERTFEGKARGAYAIANAMQDAPDAFLVTFSSMASTIGSPGQASYAAANAFVDALSMLLSRNGLRTINLNWGPWTDMGLAVPVRGEERSAWNWLGISTLSVERAIHALETALLLHEPQWCIADYQWRQVAEKARVPGLARFVEDVASLGADGIAPGPARTPEAVQRMLAKGTIVEQRAAITEWIMDNISRITGGDSRPAIHGQARLGEIGSTR